MVFDDFAAFDNLATWLLAVSHPDKPVGAKRKSRFIGELTIEDLWYRFALSFKKKWNSLNLAHFSSLICNKTNTPFQGGFSAGPSGPVYLLFTGSRIYMLIHKHKCATHTDFLSLPSSSFRANVRSFRLKMNSESQSGCKLRMCDQK